MNGPQAKNHRLHRHQCRRLYWPARRLGRLARPSASEGQLRHGWVLSVDRHDPVGQEDVRHGTGLLKKGMAGSAFDTKVKNYVFTHNPLQSAAPAGVEFVKEPIKAFAVRLREKKGKDIWMMGGAGIIRSFLDEGEIDEFMIHVIPTFIGEGIPLIAPRRRTVPLTLISSTKFTDGVVKLHYAVSK